MEKQLTLEEIIKILLKNKIIFESYVYDCGEDTNWNEINFTIEDSDYNDFVYYMDLDVHGCNISSNIDEWFFKCFDEEYFLKVIRSKRKPHTEP